MGDVHRHLRALPPVAETETSRQFWRDTAGLCLKLKRVEAHRIIVDGGGLACIVFSLRLFKITFLSIGHVVPWSLRNEEGYVQLCILVVAISIIVPEVLFCGFSSHIVSL